MRADDSVCMRSRRYYSKQQTQSLLELRVSLHDRWDKKYVTSEDAPRMTNEIHATWYTELAKGMPEGGLPPRSRLLTGRFTLDGKASGSNKPLVDSAGLTGRTF